MKRLIILLSTILINFALGSFAVVPGMVTYAEIVPPNLNCPDCSNPEVQQALLRAVACGRQQVLNFYEHGAWVIYLLCAVNVAFVALVIFQPELSQRFNNIYRRPPHVQAFASKAQKHPVLRGFLLRSEKSKKTETAKTAINSKTIENQKTV